MGDSLTLQRALGSSEMVLEPHQPKVSMTGTSFWPLRWPKPIAKASAGLVAQGLACKGRPACFCPSRCLLPALFLAPEGVRVEGLLSLHADCSGGHRPCPALPG